jgi:BirA family biotin operon repressor/biotin-[acetyl-CoA-carboxylase] ligase
MSLPTLWHAEALWEQVCPMLPGFTVEVLPEIDSSNTELMRRARQGLNEPTLLVAESQSAGRGRLGRVWQSQSGDSLTFSLSLPYAPQDWSGLSLAVGLSLAESLHPEIGLKWPNDLWWQARKLGGILIEAASAGDRSQVVIGVGINIRARSAEGLSTPPAALCEFWPEASAPAALARVLLPLVQRLQDFEREGFAPLQARFAARDVLRKRQVSTSDGLQGLCLGVSATGALRLADNNGVHDIHSSEVSARPLQHDKDTH